MPDRETLVALTAEIVASVVANNNISASDLPTIIGNVYDALASLDSVPIAGPEIDKVRGAVSARASVKPEHLVSMIDGRPYKMLRKHIAIHGYTPDSYREAFGLAKDYPMVAAEYAERRRAIANRSGLGRKPKASAPAKPRKLHIKVPQ